MKRFYSETIRAKAQSVFSQHTRARGGPPISLAQLPAKDQVVWLEAARKMSSETL